MWWKKQDGEIEKELNFHIEKQIEDNQRLGMSPEEARRQALLLFGGRVQVHEECRDLLPLHGLRVMATDLRYAARALRKSPVFTLAAVLSIALGIGANSAIFSLMHAALWKPLPVPKPGEIYHLVRTDGKQSDWSYSWRLFEQLREALGPYGAVFARGSAGPRSLVIKSGASERVMGESVSSEYFTALGLSASVGRLFEPRDGPREESMLVLSQAYWARRFGSDPSIVGSVVQYEEKPFRIIGVVAGDFRGVDAGSTTDVWVPVSVADKGIVGDGVHSSWLSLFVRAHDARAAQVVAEARFQRHVTEDIMPGENPAGRYANILKVQHVQLRPAAAGLATVGRRYQDALFVLLVIVAIVLLIACANVANLLLARSGSRQREIALRVALGASRTRLASQVSSEGVLLACGGTLAGLFLGKAAGTFLLGMLPPSRVPVTLDPSLDAAVVAFAILLGIATTFFCSAGSVWRAWQSEVKEIRVDASRITEGTFGGKFLVVGQLALSLVLTAGAGLFTKNLAHVAGADLGFLPDSIVGFELSFPRATLDDHKRRVAHQLYDRLTGREGILATFTEPGIYENGGWSTVLRAVDGSDLPAGSGNEVQLLGVGPTFFETAGIRLVAGRTIQESDTQASTPVTVVNETFAKRFLREGSPLGRLVKIPGRKVATFQIVGVVPDVKHMGVKQAVWPVMYLPALQLDGLKGTLLVRANLPVTEMLALVSQELRQVDPSTRIEHHYTLRSSVDSMLSRERLVALLSASFGALAVLLTVIGLYGVVAYNMSRRTAEIGVRVALGARSKDIRRLVLSETMWLVGLGLGLGLLGVLVAGRFVRALLFDMSPSDPWVLAVASLLMVIVSLAGAWLPAARAAATDPSAALRQS